MTRTKQLTKDIKFGELKQKLKNLGMTTDGRKKVLVKRLCTTF